MGKVFKSTRWMSYPKNTQHTAQWVQPQSHRRRSLSAVSPAWGLLEQALFEADPCKLATIGFCVFGMFHLFWYRLRKPFIPAKTHVTSWFLGKCWCFETGCPVARGGMIFWRDNSFRFKEIPRNLSAFNFIDNCWWPFQKIPLATMSLFEGK